MLYASTKQNESDEKRVFVDSTGKRKRILAISGGLAALGAFAYIGVVIMSVVQAPEAELSTKATVAATTAAKSSASTAASGSASAAPSAATSAQPIASPAPPNGQDPFGAPPGGNAPAGPR
ncbi:hypothetical protein [Actinoplanes sp. NPDC051851]|uniref:hypothetical protein n=1 Tax=Actinoplanes sp. NPDC051851 TaxID=3154753 RepID=UPI0034440CA9